MEIAIIMVFPGNEDTALAIPAQGRSPLIAKLNRDMVEILQSPAMQGLLLAQGAEPAPGTPEQLAAFIKGERGRLKKVIEVTGLRAE